jgi:hypothetical protein
MMPQEMREIARTLLEKTLAGQANWQESRFAGGRDVYIELEPYVLHVFETRAGAIVVRLRNGESELRKFTLGQQDEDYPLFSDLLSAAWQRAVNLDGVLSDLRRLVEQAGPVG